MRDLSFEDRVKGCLLGAAIGAELGFSRLAKPERFAFESPEAIFDVTLEPVLDYEEPRGRVDVDRSTPFVDLGIRAYLSKGGRVTPEDFGALLRDDSALSRPVFLWDGIHTVQELLKEGMHPRISALGIAPCGHIAAAMVGVGIYHFADPEYAYLDGVELASVAQCRLGADWAALCAVAVACALAPGSTAEEVVDTVMKQAFRADRDLYYLMNKPKQHAERLLATQAESSFVEWWLHSGGQADSSKEKSWTAYNPISFVLPLLKHYAGEPHKLMALLLTPHSNAEQTSGVVAGAILGALAGISIFPQEWIHWAEPLAEEWFPVIDVVKERRKEEEAILALTERLGKKDGEGRSLLFDKIHGCLLAGAIGNAMGSPVEGRFYWEIDEQHPGGIQTVLDPTRLEGEDDNQMAMLLVETYLKRGGAPVSARHFGDTWLERLDRDHFYPHCMGNTYDLLRKGWDPRISGHWNVVTGSTVMCMEPVGLYHPADPEYARIDATALSYMYQRGLDVIAAAILAAAVSEALRPDATVDSVCEAALDAAPKTRLNTFDERAFQSPRDYIATCLDIAARYTDVLEVRAELCDKCLLYHMIDPLELLGFSFAMFRVAGGDVRQAAVGGTNIGRDSDTISGRAAMLSGTLNGAQAVPGDWLELFSPTALERIRRNAARLADLIAGEGADRLRRRAASRR